MHGKEKVYGSIPLTGLQVRELIRTFRSYLGAIPGAKLSPAGAPNQMPLAA